jgi:hypothetical protein
MDSNQELEVQQKRELEKKEETTIRPIRSNVYGFLRKIRAFEA